MLGPGINPNVTPFGACLNNSLWETDLARIGARWRTVALARRFRARHDVREMKKGVIAMRNKRSFWTLGLAACLSLAIAAFAAKPTMKQSGKSTALTIEFRDFQGATADHVRGDGLGLGHPNCQVAESCYIDGKQKVEAKTGGEVQPNPPGIRLDTNTSGNPGAGRQLFLDLSGCKVSGGGADCTLPAPFHIDGMAFVDATMGVRPLGGPFDILFTMPLNTAQDMGLKVRAKIPDHQLWVAFDPLSTEDPGLGVCSTPSQAVSVTAISKDATGRNDAWEIEATDTTATVCGQEVAPVGDMEDFGQLSMTFKFRAIVLPQEPGKGRKK